MLRELKIENLALIDSLQLTFDTDSCGLSVLTGETGAGKSIILQALHLLGGGKGSATWVRTGADSATVEALFEIDSNRTALDQELKDQGIETGDGLILKRILAAKGRGRYYINGNLGNAAMVGGIIEQLLSIASQHDQQQLLDPRRHLEFIDALGDLLPARKKFTELFISWQDLKKEHLHLTNQEKEKEQRRDFLEFQRREILEADIRITEDNELHAEKKRLKSSDTLIQLGRDCAKILSHDVDPGLGQARKILEKMAELDENLSSLAAKVNDSFYELEDQAAQVSDYLDKIPNDPDRLEEIEARIDHLLRLQRKYGGPTGRLEDVLEFATRAEQELAELENMDRKIEEVAERLTAAEKQLIDTAEKLSVARHKTADNLGAALKKELRGLNFETPDFAVDFQARPETLSVSELNETGADRLEFMFSANPGEPLKPLAKVASGGELSRLMLALRCLLARRDQVETVILDEVDAGIGGKAADAIAEKIRELAGHHQVLCITHLSQIAAKADEHFRVSKEVVNGRTNSSIKLLSGEKQVEELGRMLAGGSVTDQVLTYARELLEKK